jgi:hypothetical protein
MSIQDRTGQARRLFGECAEVTESGRLRIERGEFQLPVSTDTAMGLALLYAKEHGPDALNESILVCRHPSDAATFAVPFHALWDFHLRTVSGGSGKLMVRPFLSARMNCAAVPRPKYFGHSCARGEGPHAILVCITRAGNPHGYQNLRRFAEDRDRLHAEVFQTRW